MNIFLIGFMGSGKSTLGKKLSDYLNVNFIDLDKYIEFNENYNIKYIFNQKGEKYFRYIEQKYLKHKFKEPFIMSVGGGTPCYYNNINYMNQYGITIFININIEFLIYNLLKNSKDDRPLLISNNKKSLLKDLFINRLFYYKKSKVTINSNNYININSLLK
ncbi:MAG: shikimate kinase [Bacteroides sp.]|nr:MAG: shikimate kinase [Bacteroides sp.]